MIQVVRPRDSLIRAERASYVGAAEREYSMHSRYEASVSTFPGRFALQSDHDTIPPRDSARAESYTGITLLPSQHQHTRHACR